MTKEQAINSLLSIAKSEVGYCEKNNSDNLDSKYSGAGNGNYTKYWRDIKPSYQGEPWCACFVTWCFVKAFGKTNAEKLLKHYPYVYCPTMANLFTLNANPNVGDIVIFKHNGTFTHTGIVSKVNGDYFETYEGNTNGGSSIVANGGSVCNKSYYNSNLPGTKFCTPDWGIVSDMTATNTASHWCDAYLNKLVDRKYITDIKLWSDYNSPVKIAAGITLIDKITGGKWTSSESDSSIHWCQPHIISLAGKGFINDTQSWITKVKADEYISKAYVLALIAKIYAKDIKKNTDALKQYESKANDHWARNYLNYLCDMAIITTPTAWTDFEGQVSTANFISLVCKAIIQ